MLDTAQILSELYSIIDDAGSSAEYLDASDRLHLVLFRIESLIESLLEDIDNLYEAEDE
jgi:hypothetical protein